MANWQLPTTASTYVNYTAELDARLDDLALGLDPALVTVTNVPTNAIRWNGVSTKWEKYNGTAWVDLTSTYAINAATASAWLTGRIVSLTGDVTATSAAWTGSANLSLTTTLPTVNSNVGSFGSTSGIPVITVNGKGLITAVSTAALGTMATQAASAVAITGGTISGATLTLKQSTTAAPTAEGVMEWDTDDDVLRIGNGTAATTIVNTSGAQTLTNKTLGSSSVWNGTAVAVAYGGTGASDAATARTNLGVASMGTQAASAVAITGGTIAGTAITLVQSTTAAPTAEGRIEWDTDNDLLILGTAAGSKVQVNTDSTQTLSNKTFGTVVYLADAGFMFDSDGGKDTGISWASDGVMNVRCNAATVGTFSSAGWSGNAATASAVPWSGVTSKPSQIIAANSGIANIANWNDYTTAGVYNVNSNWGSSTNAPSGAYSYGSTLVTNDGGTVVSQLYMPHQGGLAYRAKWNATDWQAWRYVLDSANFNSYAPTLTGTGASGTWGISITGNATTSSDNIKFMSSSHPGTYWAILNWDGAYWSQTTNHGAPVRVGYADAAGAVSNGVYTTGTQTIGGDKTFTSLTTFGNHIRVASGATSSYIYMADSDEGERSIHCNSNRIGFLTQAANWGAWCDDNGNWSAAGNLTAESDERLKTNWRDLSHDFLAQLADVKMGVYDRIDTGITQVGVSAQSLQAVLPWAVNEGESGMLSVAYGNAALAGVIALAREVAALRRELNELKGI